MLSHLKPRPARRGFTLIELLTVIAIIGILAAILIPTVGAVRSKAKALKCTTRIRTWGQAVRLMANDNRECVPLTNDVSGTAASPGKGKAWIYVPYLSALGGDANESGLSQINNGGMSAIDYFTTCPALNRATGTETATRHSYAFTIPTGASLADGKNMFGRTINSGEKLYFYRISEAVAPTKLMLMIETKGGTPSGELNFLGKSYATCITSDVVPMMTKTDPSVEVRHNGVVNVLFLDGSVRAMRQNEFDPSLMPPAQQSKAAMFYTLK